MSEQSWNVREKWKEELIYEEAGESFSFECGWGVSPPHVYVPLAENWDRVLPAFLHGRREIIVERLASTGHVVTEWQGGYGQ